MSFPQKHTIARQVKGLTDEPDMDISMWPTIDEGALSPQDAAKFLARKNAVLLYLDGQHESVIRTAAGIGLKQVYRLVRERCIQIHPDGRVYGWRGLIKYHHINGYQRKKPIKADHWGYGAAGALNTLFNQYPQLRQKIEKRILASSATTELHEIRTPRRQPWRDRACNTRWRADLGEAT